MTVNIKVQVIIPAGGSGIRFGGSVPKIFLDLGGKPLIVHCLEVFEQSPSVSSVIIAGAAANLGHLEIVVRNAGLRKVKKVVAGGETRRESIENGLKHLDVDTDMVMVHDAARPLIAVDLVEAAIADCRISGANVVAVESVSTIKKIDLKTMLIQETLDRSVLWEIQTPQTFKTKILLDAYNQRGNLEPTDDAALVEKMGHPVKVIPGSRANIKITTPEDLVTAEVLLKNL